MMKGGAASDVHALELKGLEHKIAPEKWQDAEVEHHVLGCLCNNVSTNQIQNQERARFRRGIVPGLPVKVGVKPGRPACKASGSWLDTWLLGMLGAGTCLLGLRDETIMSMARGKIRTRPYS